MKHPGTSEAGARCSGYWMTYAAPAFHCLNFPIHSPWLSLMATSYPFTAIQCRFMDSYFFNHQSSLVLKNRSIFKMASGQRILSCGVM